MSAGIKQLVRKVFRSTGFELVRIVSPKDAARSGEECALRDAAILQRIGPFTMTSEARVLALVDAVRYLSRYRIPGAIVECGVWRGGSMMAAALALLEADDTGRELFLYDTFEGMSAPTDADRSFDGVSAAAQLEREQPKTGLWCYAGFDEVKANLASTGYPAERIHFVRGKVEETIPATLPGQIALLRLDTDWYESTRHELTHLYPLLVENGVLIIDDYGHWQGARRAMDEYVASLGRPMLLNRIDYTGRIAVKTSS